MGRWRAGGTGRPRRTLTLARRNRPGGKLGHHPPRPRVAASDPLSTEQGTAGARSGAGRRRTGSPQAADRVTRRGLVGGRGPEGGGGWAERTARFDGLERGRPAADRVTPGQAAADRVTLGEVGRGQGHVGGKSAVGRVTLAEVGHGQGHPGRGQGHLGGKSATDRVTSAVDRVTMGGSRPWTGSPRSRTGSPRPWAGSPPWRGGVEGTRPSAFGTKPRRAQGHELGMLPKALTDVETPEVANAGGCSKPRRFLQIADRSGRFQSTRSIQPLGLLPIKRCVSLTVARGSMTDFGVRVCRSLDSP